MASKKSTTNSDEESSSSSPSSSEEDEIKESPNEKQTTHDVPTRKQSTRDVPSRKQSTQSVARKKSTRTHGQEVRVHLMTWNVAGSRPAIFMDQALGLTELPHPDIVGIGLQEVSPRSGQEWIDGLSFTLGTYNFVRVKYRQQLGVLTLVFVRRPFLNHCTGFESEVTKTGMAGWWGNKGGVSVRLNIGGVNIIIVNCHLAAHQNNVADRIVDFDSILDTQKFKDPDVENILDHDYIFWMGDMNFRLDNMSKQEVMKAIEDQNLRKLLQNDQLNMCREEGLIFAHFREAPIKFPPSYKFDVGTDVYDTGAKQRIPAWCDRILWHRHKTTYGKCDLQVSVLQYTSHKRYRSSDHKPVTLTAMITVIPKPPRSPVQFQQESDWKAGTTNTVRYHVNRHVKTVSSDWIGLYQVDFYEFDQYVTYIWALVGAESSETGVVVNFSARYLDVKPGDYCLCYLTKKYSLMGMSKPFKIT